MCVPKPGGGSLPYQSSKIEPWEKKIHEKIEAYCCLPRVRKNNNSHYEKGQHKITCAKNSKDSLLSLLGLLASDGRSRS